jgi:hypothetical protein
MNVDVHGRLCAAITGRFHPAAANIRSSSQRRWSSVTFVGVRHRYALCVSGDGAEQTVDRAAAAILGGDFEIDGHIVADIAVTGRRSCRPDLVEIELEALTVETR